MASTSEQQAPVHKITIIPRTWCLGTPMQVEEGERFLMSKEEALNKIATLTGGPCCRGVYLHSITTGAANDIDRLPKWHGPW